MSEYRPKSQAAETYIDYNDGLEVVFSTDGIDPTNSLDMLEPDTYYAEDPTAVAFIAGSLTRATEARDRIFAHKQGAKKVWGKA